MRFRDEELRYVVVHALMLTQTGAAKALQKPLWRRC
jgi:hypothetical protein